MSAEQHDIAPPAVAASGRHVVENVTVRVGAADAKPLVDGVSFTLAPGTITGVVGETGAGKTLTMRALLGLLPAGLRAAGSLALAGEGQLDLADGDGLRALLGRETSCVLQNPHSMLDPLQRIAKQLREGVVERRLATRAEADARARELLAAMGFADPDAVLPLYPHQLSGGMAQRVATALGMMPRPRVLVLDEPTSALDAHVRLEVLGLFRELARSSGTAVILISHDLGLVNRFCDELIVMYAGTIVERGETAAVVAAPRHPYTAALLDCSATFDAAPGEPMATVAGAPPPPARRPDGCPYVPRCPLAIARCHVERPRLRDVAGGEQAACHRAEEMEAERERVTGAVVLGAPLRTVSEPDDPDRVVVRVHEAAADYRRQGTSFRALEGVSFELLRGRTLAVVGESGAGKSTLVKLIAGFEQASEGAVEVDGAPPRLRAGKVSPVQVVFQHPNEALNPYVSVGRSVAAPLRGLPREARRARVAELLESVGLDPARAGARPRAFSGGQLQRVVLARALAASPSVLICDEATSALDVSVQAQIANLVMRLQAEQGFACLLVTHDLGLAHVMADDVLVLRTGRPVELAPARSFFAGPGTEYARGLLAATRDHQLRAAVRSDAAGTIAIDGPLVAEAADG
ncbi:MAG TPA: ABC transporter ATP-binding protein [Conexibacter sp.]|jgi:peptide/nickel transport system ATP-binding protein|nr:ABC transporter ATP-binding protein [Conexibacter sp.]